MFDPAQLLQWIARASAAYCLLVYIYGYVVKPKGDRRLHMASLLSSGVALGALSVILPLAAQGAAFLASAITVLFLSLTAVLQAFAALRGRKGDRRADRVDERAVETSSPEAVAWSGDDRRTGGRRAEDVKKAA